jgi:hypothetical protein
MFKILKISNLFLEGPIDFGYITKKNKLKLCGNQLRNFLVLVNLKQ